MLDFAVVLKGQLIGHLPFLPFGIFFFFFAFFFIPFQLFFFFHDSMNGGVIGGYSVYQSSICFGRMWNINW